MKSKVVPSSWLHGKGRRLDCGPYTSGAVEADVRVRKLRHCPLLSVTRGPHGGVFRPPIFGMTFAQNTVADPDHGVPFVTGSSMLLADLGGLPLVSRKMASSPKFASLRLQEGMTLISCSGAIGRVALVRSEMGGMWSSQAVMKVQPNREKILPGYLYSYLSSEYGIALVKGGTYGAIVPQIEREHLVDVPVPRLGEAIEEKAHQLAIEAANLRTEASRMLASAVQALEGIADLPPLRKSPSATPYACSVASSSDLQCRFDGFFHSPYGNRVAQRIRGAGCGWTTVGDLSQSVVEPTRFKRIKIDDPAHGVKLFGTSALMWAEPSELYFLPKNQAGIDQYKVDETMVLVPRSGQLSGVIGTAVLPYGDLIGGAVSEDAIRIKCDDATSAGFLFVALTSQYGLRQLKARAYGSSIPHLDVHQIAQVVVPDPGQQDRAHIGEQGARVAMLRHEAILRDREARTLVERAIEEAT